VSPETRGNWTRLHSTEEVDCPRGIFFYTLLAKQGWESQKITGTGRADEAPRGDEVSLLPPEDGVWVSCA